jgi:hypothetical protein
VNLNNRTQGLAIREGKKLHIVHQAAIDGS